jgi:hypothetical protein
LRDGGDNRRVLRLVPVAGWPGQPVWVMSAATILPSMTISAPVKYCTVPVQSSVADRLKVTWSNRVGSGQEASADPLVSRWCEHRRCFRV